MQGKFQDGFYLFVGIIYFGYWQQWNWWLYLDIGETPRGLWHLAKNMLAWAARYKSTSQKSILDSLVSMCSTQCTHLWPLIFEREQWNHAEGEQLEAGLSLSRPLLWDSLWLECILMLMLLLYHSFPTIHLTSIRIQFWESFLTAEPCLTPTIIVQGLRQRW